jgi:site-specific recombinase XerD
MRRLVAHGVTDFLDRYAVAAHDRDGGVPAFVGVHRSDLDLWQREIHMRGKGGKPRIVKISYDAARALDRYLRARARHLQDWRPQLWLGVGSRGGR